MTLPDLGDNSPALLAAFISANTVLPRLRWVLCYDPTRKPGALREAQWDGMKGVSTAHSTKSSFMCSFNKLSPSSYYMSHTEDVAPAVCFPHFGKRRDTVSGSWQLIRKLEQGSSNHL